MLTGAVVGGVVIGLFNVQGTTFVFSSIFSIPLMQPVIGYIVAIGAAFGVALAGVLMFGYQSKQDPEAATDDAGTTPVTAVAASNGAATRPGSFVNSSARTGTALATRTFTPDQPR